MTSLINDIRYLPKNTRGRDFVVGDIHGAFTLLLRAMDMVGFDPEKDRLLSVGDLIDRGPESARVDRFLDMPYVYAIRGNHEDMLLDLCENGEYPDIPETHYLVRKNGMGWWNSAALEVRKSIISKLKLLPIVLEVETVRGTAGLIHADVPAGVDWDTFKSKIKARDETVIQTALWGRTRVEHSRTEGVQGIGRLFVGHTIQWDAPKRLGNVYYVDTGAIYAQLEKEASARITIMDVLHTTMILTPDKSSLVNAFNTPTPSKPYGDYAK